MHKKPPLMGAMCAVMNRCGVTTIRGGAELAFAAASHTTSAIAAGATRLGRSP